MGKAKDFIMHQAQPKPIEFKFLKGSCCKYGIHGMDEKAQEELRQALMMSWPFDTRWFSDRKESYSWRVHRDEDGALHLEASTSMDDLPDLIDTAVWEAYGKNKFAGSGFDAAQKKHRFTDEQAQLFLNELINRADVATENEQSLTMDKDDPSQELESVLNALNELESLASGELEAAYNGLVKTVREEGQWLAKDIKSGAIQPDPYGMDNLEDE